MTAAAVPPHMSIDRAVRAAARNGIRQHVLYAQTLLDNSVGIMFVACTRDDIPPDVRRWLMCSQLYIAILGLHIEAATRDLV